MRTALPLVLASMFAAASGCAPSASTCVTGMSVACTCADGRTGAQTCGVSAYGPCRCDETDAGAVDASGLGADAAAADAASEEIDAAPPPVDAAPVMDAGPP